MNNSRFTKLERKELLRFAGLAYERELSKALEQLEVNFIHWKKSKITVFELSDLVHQFHNGIARDLWSFYASGHTEMIVAQAIINGIISKDEIGSGICEKLNTIFKYFNERKTDER